MHAGKWRTLQRTVGRCTTGASTLVPPTTKANERTYRTLRSPPTAVDRVRWVSRRDGPRRNALTAAPSALDSEIVDATVSSAAGGAIQPWGKARKSPYDKNFVLLGKTTAELESLMEKLQVPRYRSDQIVDYLLRGVKSIDDMTYIPQTLRAQLKEIDLRTGRSRVHGVSRSQDGTSKFLLQLADGRVIEAVGIPATRSNKPRLTACVSSQVGCALRCTFCATGQGSFSRNLEAHEIIDQVLTIQEEMQQSITHIVFMGMGEPLLNLNKVVRAYDWTRDHLKIAARSVTISTVGIPNAISLLAERKLQLTLAVSLHAPDQALRETLVPSAKNYPLTQLLKDCHWYYRKTGRRLTFEYALLKGVNDSVQHATKLANLLRHNRCQGHVNLMLWNRVDGVDYERPEWQTAVKFKEELERQSMTATIRKSRGLENTAACGQLSNAFQKRPLKEFAQLQ